MDVKFFVDENDLALGKLLLRSGRNIVYPGHPEIQSIPRGTKDDQWLTTVGEMGLIVITRDRRIRTRPVERALWHEHQLRGFVLTGKTSQSTTASQHLLDKNWTIILTIIDARPAGPWMYSITTSGTNEIL